MEIIGGCMSEMPNSVRDILKDARGISDSSQAINTVTDKLKVLMPWADFLVVAFRGTNRYYSVLRIQSDTFFGTT